MLLISICDAAHLSLISCCLPEVVLTHLGRMSYAQNPFICLHYVVHVSLYYNYLFVYLSN